MTLLEYEVEDLGPIKLKSPGWTAFSAWYDDWFFDRIGDGENNLSIACAVDPPPAELSAIFEDGFGFLATSLSTRLLDAAGLPGGWVTGFGELIPLISGAEAGKMAEGAPPAALTELAAEKKLRRPFFAHMPDGSWWLLRAVPGSAARLYQDTFTEAVKNRAKVIECQRSLLLSCVVWPEPEIAAQKIEETPGIVPRLTRSLREKSGEGKVTARVRD